MLQCLLISYTSDFSTFRSIRASEGVDYYKIINLFAYGDEYEKLGTPTILKPVITYVTRTPNITEMAERGHAARRVAENENIRQMFFEQLEKIFSFKKPKTAEMYDKNFINRFVINIPEAQASSTVVFNTQYVNENMRALTTQVINQVLPGYAKINSAYTGITGEAALRIGAELYRQLYFIDGALYKSIKEEKYIQDAFPDEVNDMAKNKKVTEEHVEAVRKNKKQAIVDRFIKTWKTVDAIMDVLAKYQSENFVELARNLEEEIKKQNKREKQARSSRNVEKFAHS
ncbi:hypothetical protein Ddc_16030 [Ditylenchus destructor]|nr:hypothetical protein Ddc_16030 [Ditylenchus destructor]